MKITCLAIDDEPLALEMINSYIKKVSYLEPRGIFENAFDALKILRQQKIDLLYLDINMPDLTGIDFLKGLEKIPKVIICTAHSQFAVEGFELNVSDYLLKPYSFNRFLKATERVHSELNLTETNTTIRSNDFMFVKSEHNVIKISFKDIYYIEGYKDYLKIYTLLDKPIFTINSLKAVEDLLPKDNFLRIHKSFIIAIDKIKSLRSGKVLIKEMHVPIGDSYRDIFNKRVLEGRL